MERIKLMLDFLQGPIWISDAETKEPLTGVDVVDTDKEVIELNKRISEIYDSFYEFNKDDKPVIFNHEKEKTSKKILSDLVNQLIQRLSKINDGSFVIEDELTKYINEIPRD